jgi:phosphocarrier protein HPr
MIHKDYTLMAPDGIHARPATALIRLIRTFKAQVRMKKGDREVVLTSMLHILSLVPKGGDTLTLLIEGEEETQAAAAIDIFFKEQLHCA